MIFPENQLTQFSATDIIRTNKGRVTNLNVGTNNLRAKRAENFFLVPHVLFSCLKERESFVQLLLEPFWGVKADPQTSSSREVVLMQWWVKPSPPAHRTLPSF